MAKKKVLSFKDERFVKKTKVAIVGTASSWSEAPYDDPEFEFWGVNNGYLLMPKYTRWFEIHNITYDGKYWYRRGEREFRGKPIEEYIRELANLNVPVYMQQHWDAIPKSIPYPLLEVAKTFGSRLGWYNHDHFEGAQPDYEVYLTNTISYMMALAIMEGFQEIHLYGVDMAVDTEYHWQRPSCEFFAGIIFGMGRKLYIPPSSDLLKCKHLYGFQEQVQDEYIKKLKSQRSSLEKQRIEAANQAAWAQKKEEQCVGAITMLDEVIKQWKSE